jgi:hypothetical protein
MRFLGPGRPLNREEWQQQWGQLIHIEETAEMDAANV